MSFFYQNSLCFSENLRFLAQERERERETERQRESSRNRTDCGSKREESEGEGKERGEVCRTKSEEEGEEKDQFQIMILPQNSVQNSIDLGMTGVIMYRHVKIILCVPRDLRRRVNDSRWMMS